MTRLLFGPPVQWPVSFRLVGPDPVELRRLGNELRELMAAHPHTRNTHLDWDERAPVRRDRRRPRPAAPDGADPQRLAQQLQFQLGGVPVTELRQDIRTVQLQARADRAARRAAAGDRSSCGPRTAAKLALAQLGQVEVRYEDPVIKRYNRERFLAVNADVDDAQPPDVTHELWDPDGRLRERPPEGYRIDIGGSVEQSGKADGSIQKLQPLSCWR